MLDLPPLALEHLPTLAAEIRSYWPDMPQPPTLGAQVEQETCITLKSARCWNPRTELKTAREYGFGLGQITVTARFDNFKEAKKLDASLAAWKWEDRYNAAYQLRTMVLMDRNGFRRLGFIPAAAERLAMAYGAYNGGLAGVLNDRRVCAATAGCDEDRWFGHVESTSLKAKIKAAGYGKSFFEINREYVKNIMQVRRPRYDAALPGTGS
jgi:hypothetical protein